MRNRYFLLLDALMFAGLPFLVVSLRFETFGLSPDVVRTVAVYTAASLVFRIATAFATGLYRCIWRHASLAELERVLYAGAVSAVGTFLIGTVGITRTGLSASRMPYSALFLDAVLAFGVFAGPRLFVRLIGSRNRASSNGRRAIIVGAGAAGQMILREIRLNAKLMVNVVAFADDDVFKQNQLLGGIPVLGTLDDLASMIKRLGADEVIIAMPNARGSVVRRVVHAASECGVQARTVPGLPDLISGRIKVNALRKIEIQDLLRRDPIITDLASVRTLTNNRTVLVTGAGGSIGSELCRQIAALNPAVLVTLDHSENQIFEIQGELRQRFPALCIVPAICDIRDSARLRSIVLQHRPHAIFHAAAHKHVPLMEENIVEAVSNNILGTRNLIDAALDAETPHLVNISTDKAVRPTSIMGATKRIAEKLVMNASITERRNFVSVRFGNVLGSRGSVIPTFIKQIEEGGPVRVTHPEMRRYFMTIPEAVQLVLQAGTLGKGGELFVLDMGEPVKIVDLARDLIRLSGLEADVDIGIEYTGVRPGEKLYEEVFFGGEDVRPTNHPKVLRALGDDTEEGLLNEVEVLIRRAVSNAGDDAEIRSLIRKLVPEFALEDARTNPRTRRSSDPTPVSPPTLGLR